MNDKYELPSVKFKKASFDKMPLKKGATFVISGWVYHCYEEKTKGRLLIRGLGEVEEAQKVQEEI